MWLNIAIGVATLVLTLFLYLLQVKRKYASIAHYPGPKRKFLLGNALDFGKNPVEVMVNTQNFIKKYGKRVQIWIGPDRPYIWLTDVKFLEFLLSSTKHIEKSVDYYFLHKWLGNSVLLLEGENWRKKRKFLNPAFHFQVLEQFMDVFNKCSAVLIDKLSKECGKESVNIYPYVTTCVLEYISESAMGTAINAQQNENCDYADSVRNSCNIFIERSFSVWKQFDLLYRFTESFQKQKKSLKIIHDFSKNVIAKKKMELAENEKNGSRQDESNDLGIKKKVALLDLLFRTTSEGEKLSDEDIRQEIDTFMFAGHDTTASSISFTLYEIAKHPEIQQKLVDEINILLGDDKTRLPTYQELMSLRYMEMVIKESMRLYPPAPFFLREIKEDFVFEGITYPAGLSITFFVMMLHRDPDIYEDPEKFIPERFLPERIKERNPYSYIPFSAGIRNCIGQKFAMVDMKTTICRILRNFELSEVPGHELILSSEVVLKSKSGICIRLKKRNNEEENIL